MRSNTSLAIAVACLLVCNLSAAAEGKSFWDKVKDKTGIGSGKGDKPEWAPNGDWYAYFIDEDGDYEELEMPIEENDDEDWYGLRFTEFNGPRPVVNLAIANQVHRRGDEGPIELAPLENLLANALLRTNRFEIARAGDKQARPSLTVEAAIVDWIPDLRGNHVNVLGTSVGESNAEVAIYFRILDADTGRALHTSTKRAVVGTLRGVVDTDEQQVSEFGGSSAIHFATVACFNKVAFSTAYWLATRPWSGAVAEVDGGRFWINAGANIGLENGAKLRCVRDGGELIDPDTGHSLGHRKEIVGSALVVTIEERFSVAEIIEGCDGLQTGDRVELASETESD